MSLAQFHNQLSVVTPVYNVAHYLRESLTSILAQAPFVHEVIVVDDGSTDESAAVAEVFGPPVRVVRAPHSGIGAARNRGMSLTVGPFLSVLDADDIWPDGSIADRFSAFAADPTLDLVSGHMVEFHSEETTPEQRARLHAHTSPRSGFAAGTVVFRRGLYEKVGNFRENIAVSEFIEWMSRASELGAKTTIVPGTVLLRRIHATNSSHVHPVKALDYVRVMREALERRRKKAEDGGA